MGCSKGTLGTCRETSAGSWGWRDALGPPSQSMPNAGDLFSEGLAKIQTYCYFLISYFFFLKFWVAGPSIFFFNKGQVNGVWNWMIFKDPCNSNHSITSTQPALPAICWVK